MPGFLPGWLSWREIDGLTQAVLAKEALGLIDDKMLTLVLELSDIELFKYSKNILHSIKCYCKHANEVT